MPNHCEQDLYVSMIYRDKDENGNDIVSDDVEVVYPKSTQDDVREFVKWLKDRRDEDIKNGVQEAVNNYLNFGWMIPEPTHEGYDRGDTNILENGLPTWYRWRNDNWGTKWGAYEYDVEGFRYGGEDGRYKMSYSTAWSPGVKPIRKLSEMFPRLIFQLEWFEQGMACQGGLVYIAGKLVHEWEADYYGSRGG